MELNKENIKKIIFIIFVAILIFWGFQNLDIVGNAISMTIGLVIPFIWGLILAFILNILMVKLEKILFKTKKKKKRKTQEKTEISTLKRSLTMLLSFIILILIITLVLGLVIPEFIKTIKIFTQNLPGLVENIQKYIIKIEEKYPEIAEYTDLKNSFNNINTDIISTQSIITNAWGFIQKYSIGIITSSTRVITTLVGGIVNAVIAIIFAVYLLVQKEKLQKQCKKIMYAYIKKEKCDKIMEVLNISNNIFTSFITGQCTEAVILGILCCIGMTILRIPYAIAISVLIAFTALIPIVGAIIGMVIGVFLIVSIEPIKAIVFIIFLLILQQVEGNLIYPKVVGNSVGLPGIWVLVAITIGGGLFGIVGMLVFVPIASIIYTLLRKDVNSKLQIKNINIT